ncbi:MAG: universal stress protein [Polyangiaceae bacterium]|jgi:nucleotide-binding universal stress UspA family protein
MLNLQRILVPVDFTETSDKAFDFAIQLAEKFGASVTAMHAFEIPVVGFPDGSLVATADIASRIQEAARQGLDGAVKARQGRGVKIDSLLREGSAHEEVRAVAEQIHADMIVIGTHGRKGLARALLGSVAENVIRTVKIPVLTIHGPRD